MNLNKNTTQLTESAVMAAVMALLYYIGITLFPIFILFFPVPFVVLGIKQNMRASMSAHIVSGLILFLLTDPITTVAVFITVGLIGAAFVSLIKSKQSTTTIMIWTSLAAIIAMIVLILLGSLVTGINFKTDVQNYMTLMRTELVESFAQMPQFAKSNMDMETLIDQTLNAAKNMIPTSIIVIAVIMTYASYWASLMILRKLKYLQREIPQFSRFRLPKQLFVPLMVLGIIAYVAGDVSFLNGEAIKLNLIFLFTFFFLIQGIAVLMFKFEKSGMANPLKWVIAGVIFVSGFIHPIIVGIGVLDSIIDLRKIRIKRRED